MRYSIVERRIFLFIYFELTTNCLTFAKSNLKLQFREYEEELLQMRE